MDESIVVIPAPPSRPASGLRRLDPGNDDDLAFIASIARERTAVSDTLGALNENLFMFHCLYSLRAHVHHVPALDVLALLRRDGERLVIFDVVGRRVPTFAELHPFLLAEPHREVSFRFMTDKMDLGPAPATEKLAGNNAHVFPPFPLDAGPGVVFPATSHA
jgi:hypothetical protein